MGPLNRQPEPLRCPHCDAVWESEVAKRMIETDGVCLRCRSALEPPPKPAPEA
jgi:hypothetical protein